MDQGLQPQMPTGPRGWVKRMGSWIHSTIWVLVYSKHSFPYTDCGDSVEGYTQMSRKAPFPLSFSCLESRTWFSSFLATRNRCRTESRPVGHRQRSWGGLPFVHLLSFCLRHADCFSLVDMQTTQKMAKEKDGRGLCFWQLCGAAGPHTYLSQCFRVFYYLQLNVFLTSSLICSFYHVSFPSETLSCVLPFKHTMWS